MMATQRPGLLRNVRLGPGGPISDVHIAGARIATVGPRLPLSRSTTTIDLEGRLVIPGLWDRHVHASQWAVARRRLNLGASSSAADTVERIAEHLRSRADDHDDDVVVVGYGYHPALWSDAPSKELLDRVVPVTPVMLLSNDLHTAWLNSAALHRLGAAGHETGVLVEAHAMHAYTTLGAPTDTELDGWVADAMAAATARGVVGVLDFEFADNVAAWSRRAAAADLPLRVEAALYPEWFDTAAAAGIRSGDAVAGTGGRVRVGPLKLFVDGSLNTRTALCFDPYPEPDPHVPRGHQEWSQAELERLMTAAHNRGITPALHAIGDHANRIALDAFEHVRCSGRIEHAQLLHADDLARFTRLGVVAGVQPAHLVDDRDVADRHWRDRTEGAFCYRSLLDAGAVLQFGSDAPVSPLDPWVGIAAAVSRTAGARAAWHPEQALTLREALAASTATGTTAPRVGDLADLVVLDGDSQDGAVAVTPVAATMVAGRWTYSNL